MNSLSEYYCVNIRDYLIANEKGETEEQRLKEIISGFICPLNLSIERFLKGSAVEFARKHQSVTYLVLSNENSKLLGYFTLAVKSLTVSVDCVSSTVKKRLIRVGEQNIEKKTCTFPAFLLAQFGKNYAESIGMKITGDDLMQLAWIIIRKIQYMCGGVVVFLEAKDNPGLISFYENKNGFRQFGRRICHAAEDGPCELIQFMRFL